MQLTFAEVGTVQGVEMEEYNLGMFDGCKRPV